MSSYDDIFNTRTESKPAEQEKANEPFDKDSWAEKKQAERNDAYALIDRIAEDICTDGDKFKTYLDVQCRFDRYSAGNALLIMAQMPEATKLGDFEHWKENGVSIKKQQKGITILEPGEEYTRADGSIGVSYNTKKVFDISQTTSKDKVEPIISRDEHMLLKALINNAPIAINISDQLPDNLGAMYMHDTKEILIRKGMEAPEIFRCLSQELSHAELSDENYARAESSFKAYCVSYILCKKNGFDVSLYDFKSLPDALRDMNAQEIRAELSIIRDTAASISSRMAKVNEVSQSPKQESHDR